MYVQKNNINIQANQRVRDLLAEIEQAIREGRRQRAYALSLEATKLAPENVEAWFLRATLAPSLEERLFCINCLNELCPDCQDRHNVAFFAIQELLNRDPFLAYLEETSALYRVINKNNQVVVIPKKRAEVTPYLEEPPSPLKGAYRLLVMAVFGLLLAGIGTLIFAPLAALAALAAAPALQSHSERVSSTVILILSSLLFVLGLIFGILFVLHWIG